MMAEFWDAVSMVMGKLGLALPVWLCKRSDLCAECSKHPGWVVVCIVLQLLQMVAFSPGERQRSAVSALGRRTEDMKKDHVFICL